MKKQWIIGACIGIIVIIAITTTYLLLRKKDDKKTAAEPSTQQVQTTAPAQQPTTSDMPQSTNNAQQASTQPESNIGDALYEKSIDLDGDGQDEVVQITKQETTGDQAEVQGILNITGKKGKVTLPFVHKSPAAMTGLFTGVEFADLDGDGTKDVFIQIPDAGASFSISYFYIYSYKTEKSFSFQDNGFSDQISNITSDFTFDYKGKSMLHMSSEEFAFDTNLDIKASSGFSNDDAANDAYNKSWVEPTPIDFDDNSKLGLVNGKNGITLIKVPAAIFGMGTSDVLGEINLYFKVSGAFKPALTSFEVMEYDGKAMKSVGMKQVK